MDRKKNKQSEPSDEDLELFRRAVESFDASAAKRAKGSATGTPSLPPTKSNSKSRNSGAEKHSIDLHRMRVEEARIALGSLIDTLLARGGRFDIRVVTGKGLHSGAGGGVLAREAHQFVLARYRREIISISDSPADVAISGVPLRGHFDVTIERKK